MAKKIKSGGCSGSCGGGGGFKIESLVSVDSRGQITLSREVRDKAGIKAGNKLAVVTRAQDGEIGYLLLVKEETLENMAKEVCGPAAHCK